MKLGINLLLWTTRVEAIHLPQIASIARLGYDAVEVPLHAPASAFTEVLVAELDALGLARTASTALPGPEASLISKEPVFRQAGVDYLRGVIDHAARIGASKLIGPMYQALGDFTGQGPSEDELAWAADGLRAAASHARDAGLTLCIEPLNRFECHLVNTLADGAALCRRVDHPALKLMYDSFHANIEEADPLAGIDTQRDWIAHVHLSENHRGAPGEGHLPLVDTVRRCRAAGYDGLFVIEAFGTALPDLAAATRCWRNTFANEEAVLDAGLQLRESVLA